MRLENRKRGLGAFVLVGLLTTMATGCMFFDDVDRCLDAGGEWSDATGTCLHDERDAAARSDEVELGVAPAN